MMMMIVMSNFIAHDSINLNAQCTEHVCVCLCWGAGGGGGPLMSDDKSVYVHIVCFDVSCFV